MKSRPDQTLLVIRADAALRADFTEAGELLEFWRAERNAAAHPEDAAAAVLHMGARCARTVWIICEDVWTQTLKLPKSAIAGLSEDQLAGALAFEAETLCGIAALDAVLGFRASGESDGKNNFQIAVWERPARDALQAAVERAGGTMAGLLSLNGFPASMPVNANEGVLKGWLQAAFKTIHADGGQIPVIKAAVRPTRRETYILAGVVIECIVLAICAAHWTFGQQAAAQLGEVIEQYSKRNTQSSEIEKKSAEARKELKTLDDEQQKRTSARSVLDKQLSVQKTRVVELLRSIAQQRSDEMVVESIVSQGGGASVNGIALTPAQVDDFSERLHQSLKSFGLEAQPAEKRVEDDEAGGSIWRFKIAVTPGQDHISARQAEAARRVEHDAD